MKYARLIFAIVSTTNIPKSLPQICEEANETKYQGGQLWTPITPVQGSILHAGSHLLALDVIDITLDFPTDSLSVDERDVLRMLAAGLSPKSIAGEVSFSSGLVDILMDSIRTKFRSNTIEQAVGRAVGVGTLRWTDFFANPVLEVVDRDQRVLLGGIVYWTRNNYEIISFDRGRKVRDLISFVPVEAASLSERFHISTEAITAAFGEDVDRKIWVRNL